VSRSFPLLQVVFISFLELTLKRNYLGLLSSTLNYSSVIYSTVSCDIQFAKNRPPSILKMRLLDSLLYSKKKSSRSILQNIVLVNYLTEPTASSVKCLQYSRLFHRIIVQ